MMTSMWAMIVLVTVGDDVDEGVGDFDENLYLTGGE